MLVNDDDDDVHLSLGSLLPIVCPSLSEWALSLASFFLESYYTPSSLILYLYLIYLSLTVSGIPESKSIGLNNSMLTSIRIRAY